MKRSIVVMAVALVCAAGCGTSNSGSAGQSSTSSSTSSTSSSSSSAGASGAPASAAGTAAQQAAQGAQTAAQGMAQLTQGLQQLAQNQNVKVVDSSVLKDLLPQVPGWDRSGVKGEQVSMGLSVSSAEAQYKKGDQSVKLTITDTALSQIVLAPLKMMLAAGYKDESDDGYKRAVTLSGNPGWEEWEKGSQHAQANLLIADRFVIEADANGVTNTDVARQFVQAVNLNKLSGLK
jgi:hypothetical protein